MGGAVDSGCRGQRLPRRCVAGRHASAGTARRLIAEAPRGGAMAEGEQSAIELDVGDLMAGMLGEVAVAIEGEARGGPRAVIAARRRQREQEEREALESPAKGGGEGGGGSEGQAAGQPAAASAASTPPANRAATPPEPEPEPEPAPTEPRSPESGGGARARARGLQPASPEALQATSSR